MRLSPADVLRVGAEGLTTRPARVFLSALGIAIGIAAMIGVVGISTSGQARLQQSLSRLGTDLLTVGPGQNVFGAEAKLPKDSLGMIARIPGVRQVSATAPLGAHDVYRNDRIDPRETGGLGVVAARTDLFAANGATVAAGAWLNDATARYPAVVLGATAATTLGVDRPGGQVWLGGRWFSVIGILNPVELAPELDAGALVGWDAAQRLLGFDGSPGRVYTRTTDGRTAEVRALLAPTANPADPTGVEVSRPSDALAAADAADATLTGLLLGLGAVALLVGGVGVANTMVISVLERRAEIGLRRSLGATRGQIRLQFLTESQLLAFLGGLGGVLLGTVVTAIYASVQGWPTVVPAWATFGGVLCTLLIGAVAGLYPAIRASRLPPTEALSSA
ncbi:ABC transporter permease [Actinocorallia lasiicapitis]